MTFDDDVTCEEVVFLRTHRVTFLACMVSLSYYDMNLIRDYESDSSSSEGTDNAVSYTHLTLPTKRIV